MRLWRFVSIGGLVLMLLAVFAIDVVRKTVAIEMTGLTVVRDLLVPAAFVLIAFLFRRIVGARSLSPIQVLGYLLIVTIIAVAFVVSFGVTIPDGFEIKNNDLIPLGFDALFVALLLGAVTGVFAVVVLHGLWQLVMFRRRKYTRRNFYLLLALILATSISTLLLRPMESSTVTLGLFWVAVLLAAMNSFRLAWIVYLTRREKIFTLIYSFFLFTGFVTLNVFLHTNDTIRHSILYYSYPLGEFVMQAGIFGNLYFGMAFVSTLFQLPTAEAFERKSSEVSSLHSLTRLSTKVLDFNEIVESVVSMTHQVCEAHTVWLEMIHVRLSSEQPLDNRRNYRTQVVGSKNVSPADITLMIPEDRENVRDAMVRDPRLQVVEDVGSDVRFSHLRGTATQVKSLVMCPLISHDGLLGILYATKTDANGFFKDDINMISAFADHATVAIENHRLIRTSIERERLKQEMDLAREMQRKLLPQSVPATPRVEIVAVSTPAFEVGGDYYDFIQIDQQRIGIVVGDVSGKGISAAFYMSEMKGIFQAISRLYPSPKEFIIRANEALKSSIDKHSFVSLIYAVIDTASGILTLARAGHCPMLYSSRDSTTYVRPSGMGLGLSSGITFADAIQEAVIQLREGDVCLLYTDGLTEARNGEDEFGYERLARTLEQVRGGTAPSIRDGLLNTVREYVNGQPYHDDLTIVVMKWNKSYR